MMAGLRGGVSLGLIAAGLFLRGEFASADDAEAQASKSALITVELRNMRIEKVGEVYRFVHDRAFIEHSGVGAVLTQGQVCFSSGICNGKAVEYRIPPGDAYVLKDAVIQPLGPEEQFSYTYQGEDDNGHPLVVVFRVNVKGESFEVSP